MHLRYSSKSKQEERFHENQKSLEKEQKRQILRERKNLKFFKELFFSLVAILGWQMAIFLHLSINLKLSLYYPF